jgi:hypothetical protein
MGYSFLYGSIAGSASKPGPPNAIGGPVIWALSAIEKG